MLPLLHVERAAVGLPSGGPAETRLTPVSESIAEVENEVVTPGVAATSKKRGRPSNSTLMNEKAEKVRKREEKERLDEDKFHQALNIVNTSCEVSKREAARRVSLPYSTFLDRLEALESHGAQPKGGRILKRRTLTRNPT